MIYRIADRMSYTDEIGKQISHTRSMSTSRRVEGIWTMYEIIHNMTCTPSHRSHTIYTSDERSDAIPHLRDMFDIRRARGDHLSYPRSTRNMMRYEIALVIGSGSFSIGKKSSSVYTMFYNTIRYTRDSIHATSANTSHLRHVRLSDISNRSENGRRTHTSYLISNLEEIIYTIYEVISAIESSTST